MLRFRHLLAASALLSIAPAASAQTPAAALQVSPDGDPLSLPLFRVNVDAGILAGGTYDGDASSAGVPAEGAGTRMMWYPRKAAFRAGSVNGTQWDAANIGSFSFAAGQDVRANGDYATAFGRNTVAANTSSFVAGENSVASGAASVALGYYAHTNARQGSFVFSDRSVLDDGNPATDEAFRAGANHTANWRVSNGFRIFTSSNQSTGVTIQSGAVRSNWGQDNAVISTSTGAYLSTGGTWTNSSDVNRKHHFEAVSGEDVLDRLRGIAVQTWSYRAESDSLRHMGPMAQDFHAAFGSDGVGTVGTDTTLATQDVEGVLFAATQALEARTREQGERLESLANENAALRAENTAVRAELAGLRAERAASETRLARIEAALATGAAPTPPPGLTLVEARVEERP